jgi:micrococcal nuclease
MKTKKTFNRYVFVTSIVDGDTVKGDLDLGDNVWLRGKEIRLAGLDTPEIRSKDPLEVAAAMKCREFVAGRLEVGKEYPFISTEKADKYGRAMGSIHDAEGNDVGSLLINLGYARCYHGDKKEPWAEADLNRIVNIK